MADKSDKVHFEDGNTNQIQPVTRAMILCKWDEIAAGKLFGTMTITFKGGRIQQHTFDQSYLAPD